jgi:hypothetical protein
MTKEERQIIIDAAKSQPRKSYDRIAADLGVSKPTLLSAIKGAVERLRGRKLSLNKAG